MPIFEYKCESCSSVFEHFYSSSLEERVACVNCGSRQVARTDATIFSPNKNYCPHEDENLSADESRGQRLYRRFMPFSKT